MRTAGTKLLRKAWNRSLPDLVRDLFSLLERQYEQLQVELKAIEVKLKAFAQTLIDIQQRLQLLINLPADKLQAASLQAAARELAQA